MNKNPLRLAMLISGGGSTMQAIGLACKEGSLKGKIEPVVVISSKVEAAGIEKAKNLSVPVEVVQRKDFEKGATGAETFGQALSTALQKYHPDIITQNGWLPYTPKSVIDQHEGKIFNQHPGPLDPDNLDHEGQPLHFGGKGMHGLAVHAAVLKFQQLTERKSPTEATVHRVTQKVDGGKVVFRKEVPVHLGDTPESLAKRVLPIEHECQIAFLSQFYDKKVKELKRESPLVHPGEEDKLWKAKEFARRAYPNG